MADDRNRTPQPLVDNQPIVNERGLPTQYFIRWAQERQIAIEDGITADQAQQLIIDYLAAHALQAGHAIAITPSGSIADDPTIAFNGGMDDLSDVDLSTPPTDQQVLVWDDAAGNWVPADQSGGGGGGGTPGYLWAPATGGLDDIDGALVTVTGSHSGTPQNAMRTYPINDWFWNGGVTAGVVDFDFGVPVTISGIGFLQDNNSAEGGWQAAGSNDGVTYTNLGAPGIWGGAVISGIPFANTTAYRYYRTTQVSGATSSSPYQQMFLFRYQIGSGGGGGGSGPWYFNPPHATDFPTLGNSLGTDMTLTDDTDVGLVLEWQGNQGSNDDSEGCFKALPAGVDWTVIVHFLMHPYNANYIYGGPCVRNSGANRGYTYGQFLFSGALGYFLLGQNGFAGQTTNSTFEGNAPVPMHMKLQFNSTTDDLSCSLSGDGKTFRKLRSDNIASYLGTPDLVGFKLHTSTGDANHDHNPVITVDRWEQDW